MGTFPHSPTPSQGDVFLFQHPIAGEMFKTQMLNKVFIQEFLPAMYPPTQFHL